MAIRHRWATTAAGALVVSAFALPALAQEPASSDSIPGEDCSGKSEVVRFGHGSAKLNGDAREKLSQVADELRTDDTKLARVEAFADATGDAQANQILTDKRARAVESYLNRKGVDKDRVEVFGRGEVSDQSTMPDPERRIARVTSCQRTMEVSQPAAEEAPPPPPETPPPVAEPAPETTIAPPPQPSDQASAEVARSAREAQPRRPLSLVGVGMTAGGGVVGFNDKTSRSLADTGGSWDVRLTLGTRLPLGLDVAYVGSAQSLTATGFSSNAYILGNGAEADLRLQWPKGMLRPFVFGGVGWTHYSVERSTVVGTGLTRRTDDIGTVPLGLGLAVGMPMGVMFEVRLTERLAFDDQLFRTSGPTDTGMDSWNGTARLGAEF
jgi:outer membrane protein OmpA-like peptidoglycan-associated protein